MISHNRQLGRNSISNFLVFFSNVLINIWIVPYLINRLGVAVYGSFPLSVSLIGFMNLATFSLNNAVTRYLTISIQQNKFKDSNVIFNSSLFGSLYIFLLLSPFVCIFMFNIKSLITIPTGHDNDIIYLYIAMLTSYIVTTFSGNFCSSLFAINRIDLKNIPDIVSNVLRAFFIIILFFVFSYNIFYVGLSYFISSIFGLFTAIFLWKKYTPNLNIKYSFFDWSMFKTLSALGFWIIINQLGSLLFLNVELIVVSKLFGPTACGEYASVLQWSTLLRNVAGVIAASLTPLVMIHYAAGRFSDVVSLMRISMRIMGFSMAFFVGIICGFARPILKLWLGPEFQQFDVLLWVQISHLVINLAVLPLFAINLTLDKIKVPGIISLLLGIINIILAISLSKFSTLGITGVALAGAIILTLKNALFTPWYCSRILNVSLRPYITIIIQSLISFSSIFIITYSLSNQIYYKSITIIILISSFLLVLYSIVQWRFIFSSDEKAFLLSCLPNTKRIQ